MAIQSKVTLKSYFETGDIPTQEQYVDLIDSFMMMNALPDSTGVLSPNGTKKLIVNDDGTTSVIDV
jgi:hypothetical protein